MTKQDFALIAGMIAGVLFTLVDTALGQQPHLLARRVLGKKIPSPRLSQYYFLHKTRCLQITRKMWSIHPSTNSGQCSVKPKMIVTLPFQLMLSLPRNNRDDFFRPVQV